MDLTALTLNGAYVLYVASSLFRNPLKLRVALIATSVAFIVYGIVSPIWSVVWWNLAFGLSHLVQLLRTVRDRMRVSLSSEDEAMRSLLFDDLDRLDFFTLWSVGHERTVDDSVHLCTEGEPQSTVAVVLDGTVDVRRGGSVIKQMGPGRLVGERTFLGADIANADVVPSGKVRIREWDHDKLSALDQLNPNASRAFRNLVGRDLATKLSEPE